MAPRRVLDHADHDPVGRGDRHRHREVAHEPPRQGSALGTHPAASHEVELAPPVREPDPQPPDAGDDSDRRAAATRAAVDDTADHLPQHDDGEQVEPLDHRLARVGAGVRVAPLRQSKTVMPAIQPTTTSAQAARRAPSGSSALAPTTVAETRTPAMYGVVAGRNAGSSWRRTEYQSQPSMKRYAL